MGDNAFIIKAAKYALVNYFKNNLLLSSRGIWIRL